MRNREIKIVVFVFIMLSVACLVNLNFEVFKVYPFEKNSQISIGISHEEVLKNWSEGNYRILSDSTLAFQYKLSDSLQEPFAGVYIHKQDSLKDAFLDFSNYDLLSIELKAKNAKRIPVFLTLDYNGFTKVEKPLSWMPLSTVIDYTGEGVYEIQKQDFEIPSWWLRYHEVKKEDFTTVDFSRVTYIVINSCQAIGPGIEDEIQIKSIVFFHNNKTVYVVYILAVVLMGLLYGAYYLYTSKKKVMVPYKTQEDQLLQKKSKIDRIVFFIAEHYANPELTPNDMQKTLGISEREIGVLIKNHLDHSFKSYLNTIRLTEVKRLLLETQLPISDIAYMTGYNNIPHFNRVFKKETNASPKEYRESQS